MALSHIQHRGAPPESAVNLACAQVTLEALLLPNSKPGERQLREMRDEQQEELDHDPLGSASGIVNGLRLSMTLWSFIALVVLLVR